MQALLKFLKNDHIQAAIVSGLCILIIAVVFKKVMRIQATLIEQSIPGFIFTIWELTHKKTTSPYWVRPYLCMVLMLISTAVIILRHVIWSNI